MACRVCRLELIENPKEFMTEEEIRREDDSVVTIYKPEKCYNGYSVFSFEKGPPETRMVDMNGRIINRWQGRSERSKYLENNNLLRVGRTEKQILELDWEGNIKANTEAGFLANMSPI